MSTRRKFSLAAVVVVLAALVSQVRAEVAVETDAFGNYVRTSVLTHSSVRQYRIWRVVRRRMWGTFALNPDGDRRGDQFPAILENPAQSRHPWAVWSRFNGTDYDLAWSRWRNGGWTPIRWLSRAHDFADDLGPSLTFDSGGRAYTGWWRDEEGRGRVYLSFFLVTRWAEPIPISDPGVDSRAPRITAMADGGIMVEYHTPTGSEYKIVSLIDPTTINDDLNPVGQVSVTPVLQNTP